MRPDSSPFRSIVLRSRGIPSAVGLSAALLAAGPAAADITGQVVDPDGQPLKGGRACILLVGAEGLCTDTDDAGYYALPDTRASKVRITAPGFLPRDVAALDQPIAIVLDRAASLRVRLADLATGEPAGPGEVVVSYATGRQIGPFPIKRGDLTVKTLAPGRVLVRAEVEGYESGPGELIELPAGRMTEVVVRLSPEGAPPRGDGDAPEVAADPGPEPPATDPGT